MMNLDDVSKVELYEKYIGAVSLLGRISSRHDLDKDSMYGVERATDDLVGLFPESFEKVETGRGGIQVEPNP
jgi:hypothetical protein